MSLRNTTLFDNFKWIDEGNNEKERIERLKSLSSPSFKMILDYIFNPNIKWVIDENIEYVPCIDEPSTLVMNLQREIRKLHIYLNFGEYAHLKQKKKTQLFIQLLEGIHQNDAVLMMNIKDKHLPFKNITANLIKKAFPPTGKNFTSKW